ncbi:hypothetical protein ACJ6WD_09605 [Streptomyces sp. VTCC 41912]|uniref:hypothetical protein n=1 Tax=Streptomyces TaxID=1883 RepID=UPI002F265009
MTGHIRMDQIYSSCDPRGGPRIRITDYLPGDTHAGVVDAHNSKRPRKIRVSDLHATDTTKTGAKRRTGYALEEQ